MTVAPITQLALGFAGLELLIYGGTYWYVRRKAEVSQRAFRAFSGVFLLSAVLSVGGGFFAVELFHLVQTLPPRFRFVSWLDAYLIVQYAVLGGLTLFFLSFVALYVVERWFEDQ